jgi:4-amino-4-deoxy-L-arabinose transferase-like glycosyltransferase
LNNTAVHSISSIPSFFFGSTFNTGGTGKLGGVYYRPLMMITFATLYQVAGAQAWLFHLFQVILHLTTGVLVFLLLRKFIREDVSWFLSAIYLIHPINVESVAYIAAIQDVAYVFFCMLIFVYYFYSKQSVMRKAFVTAICMLCALLSKEVACMSINDSIYLENYA